MQPVFSATRHIYDEKSKGELEEGNMSLSIKGEISGSHSVALVDSIMYRMV